jgi:hypothetical protein
MKRYGSWLIATAIAASLLGGCGDVGDPSQPSPDSPVSVKVRTKQDGVDAQPPGGSGLPPAGGDGWKSPDQRWEEFIERARVDPQELVSRCLSENRFVDISIDELRKAGLTPGMSREEIRRLIQRVARARLEAQWPGCTGGRTTLHELVPQFDPSVVRCYPVDMDAHMGGDLGTVLHRPGYVGGVAQVRRIVCGTAGAVVFFVDFSDGCAEAAADDRGNGGIILNGLCHAISPIPLPITPNDAWRGNDKVQTLRDRMDYQLECEARLARGESPPPEIAGLLCRLSGEIKQAIVTCYSPDQLQAYIDMIRRADPNVTDQQLQRLVEYLKCPTPNHHTRIDIPWLPDWGHLPHNPDAPF